MECGHLSTSSLFPVTCPALASYSSQGLIFSENHLSSGTNAGGGAFLMTHDIQRGSLLLQTETCTNNAGHIYELHLRSVHWCYLVHKLCTQLLIQIGSAWQVKIVPPIPRSSALKWHSTTHTYAFVSLLYTVTPWSYNPIPFLPPSWSLPCPNLSP
jgi:hypothetical protein